MHRTALVAIGLAVIAPDPARVQGPETVRIPKSMLACFYENRAHYLEFERVFVKIVPEACPRLGPDAARWLARNSGGEEAALDAYVISSADKDCLIGKITTIFEGDEGGAPRVPARLEALDDPVVFLLDCP